MSHGANAWADRSGDDFFEMGMETLYNALVNKIIKINYTLYLICLEYVGINDSQQKKIK